MTSNPSPFESKAVVLTGGVVAYNEERNIGAALRSLQEQCLPAGTRWGDIWVVASGCLDRTAEIAQGMALSDQRIHVIIEPKREGKAHALSEVLRRATGDYVVFLNADAIAGRGAVGELLHAAAGHAKPLAVMGRPVVSRGGNDLLANALRLQWALHDELHREMLGDAGGTHLSDELLLMSLPGIPEIPHGIINDGSYIGGWLTCHGGERLYATEAIASVEIASTFADHLLQRRRIRVGHVQSYRATGVAPVPTSFPGYFIDRPAQAGRLLRRALRRSQSTWRTFAFLALAELVALGLAAWDALPPQRDYARWERIHANLADHPEPGAPLGSPGGRSAAYYR